MERLRPETGLVTRQLVEREAEHLGQRVGRRLPDVVDRDRRAGLERERRERRVVEPAGGDPLGERRGIEVDVERVAVRRDPA